MCVDEDKCVSGYGYWTVSVSVGVGPSLSERLPTYLYQRGSGPNVVRNVKSILWVWDRALVKATYIPLPQRIRSECSSKCGVCEFLFGSSKCMCGALVWKGKVVRICMCRLLVRRCKIVWL